MLSDNGLCFSGKLRGYEVMFESHLRDAGVRPMTGRAYHPQTTGKVERFQQTLKAWLRRQPLAADLIELQAQLDTFCQIYNHERPHQGIGRATPISRWHASPATRAANEPLQHPATRNTTLHHTTVRSGGSIAVTSVKIYVGREWCGHDATVFIDQDHATVFINGLLVRHLKLDRTREYQPSGQPSRRHQPKN
jgi:hypothetical protein